jgi:hypothetical protein
MSHYLEEYMHSFADDSFRLLQIYILVMVFTN